MSTLPPVRIAVLTPTFPTRAEPYRGLAIWSLLRELARRAELTAYCSLPHYYPHIGQHRDFIHDTPWLESFAEVPAETLRFPAVPALTRPINGALLAHPLRRALSACRPDALVAFWVYPEGDAALRASGALGIPLTVISVGSDLKKLSPHPFIRRRARAVLSEADEVLAVSEDLCQTARQLGGQRVRLLQLGIDHRVYSPREVPRQSIGVPEGVKLILFAGRFVPLKGLPRLLDAFALLERGKWFLALAGNGSEEPGLREKIQSLGLGSSVRFLGSLPPAEVARWMNAADLLCLPSESEGRPNVILEALGCGCPVVATPVGGIPELVQPACGVLVSRQGPEGLAEALREAAGRTWDRAAIARSYRRPWSDVATEVLEACARAIARRAPSFTETAAAPG